MIPTSNENFLLILIRSSVIRIFFRYPFVDNTLSNIMLHPERMSESTLSYYSGVNLYSFWVMVDRIRPLLPKKKISVPAMVLLYRYGPTVF